MVKVEYTKEQAKIIGSSEEIPSILTGTWDTESNAERMLHILSVVPTEEILREAKKCEVFPRIVEVLIQSDSRTVKVPTLEVPLWVVPKEIGYNFLLVEEIDFDDRDDRIKGDYTEKIIIVETTKTYQEAEEKRESLLSS